MFSLVKDAARTPSQLQELKARRNYVGAGAQSHSEGAVWVSGKSSGLRFLYRFRRRYRRGILDQYQTGVRELETPSQELAKLIQGSITLGGTIKGD